MIDPVRLELSADLGEGSPDEDAIWPLLDAANVACGGHVGDRDSMLHAAQRARELRVTFGAHPSYPDREHFGRRSLTFAPSALRATLSEQLETLRAIAGESELMLTRVKPHGALYNDAHRDPALAAIVIETMRAIDPALAIVCPDHSQMAAAARAAGTAVIREAFADRRYAADGSLAPRSEPGSTLDVAAAVQQALSLANSGSVVTAAGTTIAIPFDTLCVHADMPHALERLQAIHAALAVGRGSR